MFRTRTALSFTALLSVASATPAAAQPAGAQAETLFRQGKALLASGKVAEACDAFDASQRLEPTTATLLNQASCREKNNQFATAWGLFLEAERQTRGSSNAERQLHDVAASHAAKLEPRLSTLTISVATDTRVGGLQILRNGEVVDPGAWNRALPVDGGSYKITASAPGNAEWSSEIVVGNERDAKSIDVPRLKAAEVPTRPEVAAAPAPAPSPHRSRVVPLIIAGGAVVLAGAALGFELSARSTYDKTDGVVDDKRQESLWRSANHKRYAGEALAVASVAAAGVAVYLYLRPNHETEAQSIGLHITPTISSNSTGFALIGNY